jgi:hypothetical protein
MNNSEKILEQDDIFFGGIHLCLLVHFLISSQNFVLTLNRYIDRNEDMLCVSWEGRAK